MDFEYTKRFKMPLLLPNQSGKEITHNEALIMLDNLLQNVVIDKDLMEVPQNPNVNDCYIVAENATNSWYGKDNQLAFYDNGWRFSNAVEGFFCFVKSYNCFYIFINGSWQKLTDFIKFQKLADVQLTNIQTDDIMVYNGTKFVNSDRLNIAEIKINNNFKFEISNNCLYLKKFDNNSNSWINLCDFSSAGIDFKQQITVNGQSLSTIVGNSSSAIVESNSDSNGNFYVVFQNGFCIQCFKPFTSAVATSNTLTFLRAFRDTNYTLNLNIVHSSGYSGAAPVEINNSRTTTQVQYYHKGGNIVEATAIGFVQLE